VMIAIGFDIFGLPKIGFTRTSMPVRDG